jgi:hypothetical protein
MKILLSGLSVTFLFCNLAIAGTIVAENGPHAAFNAIPFGSASGPGAGEYQEIYSASLFGGPVDLTSFAFSPDTTGLYSANVVLRLTTTSVSVGSLSNNLNSNFATPLTTVFSNAAFSESVTGGSETFSLVFDLTTPFLYNPASGNLLLDVLISGQTYSGFGFSRSDAGPIISRAYNVAIGNNADSVGLRTTIGFTSVPEPGTMFLTLVGLATALVVVSGKSPSRNPCVSKRPLSS